MAEKLFAEYTYRQQMYSVFDSIFIHTATKVAF